jgi:hypothetical protein
MMANDHSVAGQTCNSAEEQGEVGGATGMSGEALIGAQRLQIHAPLASMTAARRS